MNRREGKATEVSGGEKGVGREGEYAPLALRGMDTSGCTFKKTFFSSCYRVYRLRFYLFPIFIGISYFD